MPQNKNEILKDIAVKLGGTPGKNDNDTNELLSVIKDAIPEGGSALYRHKIKIIAKAIFEGDNSVMVSDSFEILTNFQTELNKDNITKTLVDYYIPYGTTDRFKVHTFAYAGGSAAYIIVERDYPGNETSYIGFSCSYEEPRVDDTNLDTTFELDKNGELTISSSYGIVSTSEFIILDTVSPL